MRADDLPHPDPRPDPAPDPDAHGLEIAIIGLAGRFPGAPTLDAYWRLLAEGREGIQAFSDDDLLARGLSPAQLAQAAAQPGFVKAGAPIEGAELFDATLFGLSAREAELMDPQHRLFLECCWQALEHAGCDPEREAGAIGVFGGAGMNGYLLNLYAHAETRANASPYDIFLGNDKDFLATRVAYKLGLRGPAVAVQTACSSSLVAVHLACQSLLAGECDLALAGGVALSRQLGYVAAPGGIHAPDGHCRAFSAQAAGTVPGNGVGVVLLRRLDDALAAGDTVLAVVKGSAINNDGGLKQSFTAPSGERQAAVIEAALVAAGVSASSIDCVEAHGTGTRLGDPVEVDALARVYRRQGAAGGRCALGSVKSNIGHLDAAAGIAGLIKLVLALQARQIPPTLHAAAPNPQLGLDSDHSPFHLAQALAPWPATPGRPRRAALSSFGIGGTNAHLVLQEAPAAPHSAPTVAEPEAPQLLLLSAHSAAALDGTRQALADWLQDDLPGQALPALARTLQQGRRALPWRQAVLADSPAQAAQAWRSAPVPAGPTAADTSAVWLFSGQGSQRPQMARRLTAELPAYAQALQACAEVLDPLLPLPLHTLLCAPPDARAPLDHTAWAQPALFAHEWALAAAWRQHGVAPRALAGHSLGEWVAACLAGVFTLPQALRLVVARGRLMQAAPAGAMWAVAAAPEVLMPWLSELGHTGNTLSIAAHNAPDACVLAGPAQALAALAPRLAVAGIGHQALHTSHAFHSPAMDGAAAALAELLAQDFAAQPPQAPRTPVISGVTGTWLTAEQAASPAYWAQQLRAPVQFATALQTLQTSQMLPGAVFIEIGPGRALAGLARSACPGRPVLASQPQPGDTGHGDGRPALLQALGAWWCAGGRLDLASLSGPGPRLAAPGLALQRQRYWVDADLEAAAHPAHGANADQKVTAAVTNHAADSPSLPLSQWASQPGWRSAPLAPAGAAGRPGTWLLLDRPSRLAEALAQRLEAAGDHAFTVQDEPGLPAFAQRDFRAFALDAGQPAHWQALRAALDERALPATGLVDLRPLHDAQDELVTPSNAGLDAPALPGPWVPVTRSLALLQALADNPAPTPLQLLWVTRGGAELLPGERPQPAQAALLGLALVPGQELPTLGARVIDLAPDTDALAQAKAVATLLAAELRAEQGAAPASPAPLIAWRGRQRWAAEPVALPLPEPAPRNARGRQSPGLRRGAHVLLLGDFERGLGALWAERLATAGTGHQAGTLSLVSATPEGAPVPAALLQRLQAVPQGPVLRVFQAASDDGPALRAALQAVSTDGAPDGVFVSLPTTHAGIAAPLALLTPAHWAHNQRARLDLLHTLAPWVAAQSPAPAWCCVQSSMSAQLGGLGLAAYAAASQAVDALVSAQAGAADASGARTRWLAIDWDPVAGESETPAPHGLGAALQAQALSADEAWAVTERALTAGLSGVLAISRTPLAARRAAWLRTRPAALAEAEAAPGLMPARAAHPRPPLATPYQAPRNDTEARIAALWQELLRLETVGVDDSFFELGGHSLLAIQAIGRLRQSFAVTLELRDLLEGTPTVAGIAALIERQTAPAASSAQAAEQAAQQDADLAALLAEVQALSPEDVQAQLQRLDAAA